MLFSVRSLVNTQKATSDYVRIQPQFVRKKDVHIDQAAQAFAQTERQINCKHTTVLPFC